MSEQWPTVKLGEVLRLDLDRHSIDAATTYPMVGVLSFGRGLFDREPIENGNTSYRVFYRLKAKHIVMSQLFGWEGALALSSEKFAGKFLSPQFPTFLCDEKTLNREFLGWLMRRPAFWEDLGSRTSGMGDRRRTLNPDALFKCDIPLPPLAEQRRLVARIDELAAKIHEASTLRQQAVEEAEALLVAMAHRSDLDIATKEMEGWKRTKLSDVIEEVDDSHVVKTDHSYPNLGMYSFGRGLFHKPPIDGLATSAKSLRRVKEGQFIYSRLFAFEGAYGMVTKEFDGAFVSQEVSDL
jgi:type I restriction enzyme S subunit